MRGSELHRLSFALQANAALFGFPSMAPARGIAPRFAVLETALFLEHAGKWLSTEDSNPERFG